MDFEHVLIVPIVRQSGRAQACLLEGRSACQGAPLRNEIRARYKRRKPTNTCLKPTPNKVLEVLNTLIKSNVDDTVDISYLFLLISNLMYMMYKRHLNFSKETHSYKGMNYEN